jgi:hypothetical protein
MKDNKLKLELKIISAVFFTANLIFSLSKTLLYANQVNGIGRRFYLSNYSFSDELSHHLEQPLDYLPVIGIVALSGCFLLSTFSSMQREAQSVVAIGNAEHSEQASVVRGPGYCSVDGISSHWKSAVGVLALVKCINNMLYPSVQQPTHFDVVDSLVVSAALSVFSIPSVYYCNRVFLDEHYQYAGSDRWKAYHASVRAGLDSILYFTSYNEFPKHLGGEEYLKQGSSGLVHASVFAFGCLFLLIATAGFYYEKLGGGYRSYRGAMGVQSVAAITKGVAESYSLYAFLLVDAHMQDLVITHDIADKCLYVGFVANILSEFVFFMPKGCVSKLIETVFSRSQQTQPPDIENDLSSHLCEAEVSTYGGLSPTT